MPRRQEGKTSNLSTPQLPLAKEMIDTLDFPSLGTTSTPRPLCLALFSRAEGPILALSNALPGLFCEPHKPPLAKKRPNLGRPKRQRRRCTTTLLTLHLNCAVMPREAEPSINERAFILQALAENIRLDGRAFDTYRQLHLSFGHEYGLADVRLGKTR